MTSGVIAMTAVIALMAVWIAGLLTQAD